MQRVFLASASSLIPPYHGWNISYFILLFTAWCLAFPSLSFSCIISLKHPWCLVVHLSSYAASAEHQKALSYTLGNWLGQQSSQITAQVSSFSVGSIGNKNELFHENCLSCLLITVCGYSHGWQLSVLHSRECFQKQHVKHYYIRYSGLGWYLKMQNLQVEIRTIIFCTMHFQGPNKSSFLFPPAFYIPLVVY